MAPTKDDIETHERIARLEEKVDSHVEGEEEAMAAVARKLDRIELELSRYRGFIGGILLMVTAVITFFKLFWADISNHLK